MTDLVYITGGRSAWQDNELRYSLRSMRKHLSGIGNVFIVGTCPEWLRTEVTEAHLIDITGQYTGLNQNTESVSSKVFYNTGNSVVHTPAADHPNEKKEPRLYRKVLGACRDERISSTFLLCYDDNFLLTLHNASDFPNYYEGDFSLYLNRLRGTNRKGTHRRCAENTVNSLGLTAKMFDVHCPILVNREKFQQAMSQFDWDGRRDGYLLKSTYANSMGLVVTECLDTKLNHPDGTLREYRQMIEGKPWFSTGDNMNWEVLLELMEELYPTPSMWEKPCVNKFLNSIA